MTLSYEMALGRMSWDDILDAFGSAFPKALVVVSAFDAADQRGLALAHRGLDERAQGPSWQPSIVTLAADAPTFEVFHVDRLVPRTASRGSTRLADASSEFLASTGAVLARNGGRIFVIEIRYPDAREAETRVRATALLRHVGPHLGRAIELSRREAIAGLGELEDVVDTLPFGVFFVDRRLHVHYANRRADEARRSGHGPFVAYDGKLRALDAESDTQLREAVLRVGHGARGGTVALKLNGPAGERYFVAMRVLQSKSRQLQLHDAIFTTGPLVLVSLHDAEQQIRLPVELLWRNFSLTDAEGRLAEALVNGWTLAELAQDLQVSKQTLRNQLVGLMRKTGTKRQSQLISLLTRLSLGSI